MGKEAELHIENINIKRRRVPNFCYADINDSLEIKLENELRWKVRKSTRISEFELNMLNMLYMRYKSFIFCLLFSPKISQHSKYLKLNIMQMLTILIFLIFFN